MPGVATLAAERQRDPAEGRSPLGGPSSKGNKIRTKPYRWGGGHARWKDKGHDCSGAVSYVLHAAGLLKSPLPSGPLARVWGAPGMGRWITVYANGGHAYAVIAGLRWDTSAVGEALNSGSGPRWRRTATPGDRVLARFAPSIG